MATTPPMIGGADPAILKSLERQSPSIARTSPATISASTGAATSSGGSVSRGIVPSTSGSLVTYNQATQSTSGNSVTVTSSSSNDPADVVTVYTSPRAVSVSAVNQTVNNYKVNNYAGNEYSNNNVANYLPTYTGTISAGNLNVSTSANLGSVGNITILGGTSGQLLTTNGSGVLSWVNDPGNYGNSDVANYLPTFTGNIRGNVITANLFSGNGSSLTSIPGANVTGTVANATNAGTANSVAGANVSGVVANATYAVTAGTANSVAGANVSGAVSFATTANSVALANVSGAGNIANINLDGSSSNVLYGNGVWSAASTANTGNVTFDDINIIGTSNLKLQPDSTDATAYVDIFLTAGPDIHLAGNGANIILGTDGGSNVMADTSGNVTIQASSGSAKTWTFDTSGNLTTPGDLIGPAGANFAIHSNASVHEFIFGDDGTFYAPDNVVLGGSRISIGPGANNLADLTNAVFIASSTGEAYIQGVIENVSDNGSADWVALGHRGDDTGGWADIGFTSSGFNDANYTITGPGDGYVFTETYAPGAIITGPSGGNLVLATGSQGTVNDIIFGTGGFLTANVFGRISDANNSLELSRTGASITFPDGSIQTTAYTGGGGGNSISDGTSNVTVTSTDGNVVIGVDNDAASWTFASDGAIYTKPENDLIFVVADPQGDGLAIEQSVTDGTTELSRTSLQDGQFSIYTNLDSTSDEWRFDGNTLQVTTNSFVRGFDANITIQSMFAGSSGTASLQSVSNQNDPNVFSTFDATPTGANIKVYNGGSSGGTEYVWQFDNDGNLTLPANTFAVNYANGTQVSLDGSNISNGNSNVSIATANGNVTISAVGNTTMTVTGTGANITGTLTSTGKIGYASGSTVTQITSRGTGVTINALAGTIITTSVAMVANEIDTFSVINSSVDPNNDIVLAQIVSPNQGTYNCIANPAVIGGFSDGFYINIVNISGFTTSDETITIRFMVIKAPNA